MLGIGLLVAAISTTAPSPNPYEIFARARQYWQAQHYPGLLEYTVAVSVVEGGKLKTQRYRGGYDDYDGTIRFDPISDYEAAHPYVPKGVNLGFLFWRIGRAEPPVDYLGAPDLAPNYGFGIADAPLTPVPQTPTPAELVRQIRQEFHDPDPRAPPSPTPQPSAPLLEIATVTSRTRAYDISLAGVDDVEGHAAYHLKMRPLREPGKYRLRDLWVDTASFAPRKLIEAKNFLNGPGTAVPWSVSFVQVNGGLYIDREVALAPMEYRGLVYTQATVSIEGVHEVTKFSDDLSTFIPGGLIMEEP